MSENRITPEKVTKPIQLLAAWLVGLIVVNASFLLAAQQISKPDWASALLVISSVANVPLFIGALFLLQTKFRPQIQEDSYYAKYLESERQYSQSTRENAVQFIEHEITQTAEKIVKSLGAEGKGKEAPVENILRESQLEIAVAKFGKSRTLSELYLSPSTWNSMVSKWGRHSDFLKDADSLIEEGLIDRKSRGYRRCTITQFGRKVAMEAEKQGMLFAQVEKSFWEEEHDNLAGD